MTVDEPTLRAYVDGELEAREVREVEEAIEASEELQRQVRLLRASRLPYHAAYAAQTLPEVPDQLHRQIEAWVALCGESERQVSVQRRRWLGFGAGLAASFAAGLWVPIPLRLHRTPEDPPWVQAIARYQSLYVRETFDRGEDIEHARVLLAAFAAAVGGRVSIPDLRPLGLTLRRVQRLAVGDVPLIQMEYLPPSGKPMSLSVLAGQQLDSTVVTRRVADVGVSTWRRGGFEFVMAADMPVSEIARIAGRAASGELPVLYRSDEEAHGQG